MSRSWKIVVSLTALLLAAAAAPAGADDWQRPAHPRELTYGELEFTVPDGAEARHLIDGEVPVYVVEEHALPLVEVSVTARIGSWLEPAGKTGLASLTGTMLRQGGTESLTPAAFDERADFLAAQIESYIAETEGGASLSCITRALDDCLDLFFDMLSSPRFDTERLEVEKGKVLEEMKQRNDQPFRILFRELGWLLRGEEHFASRQATADELAAIGRQDLLDFHRRYWDPRQMIFAVSGDVETEAIVAELERRLADWPSPEGEVPWPPPPFDHQPRSGLYHYAKDIPQGNVQMAHLTVQRTSWDDPDAYALELMNAILGGGGFTSRIMQRVRSDEGLAYSAGSRFALGTYWPGTFNAGYQSKNTTVALAAQIVLEEIERIRREVVSNEELETSRAGLLGPFPRRFETASQRAQLFASDAYLERPHSYWQSYEERIQAVTEDDVLRVAQEYLHPDELVLLVVGKWDEIAPGDPEGRASMAGFGEVTHLPQRDPLTMEPVEAAGGE